MPDNKPSDRYHAMPDEFFWSEGQKKIAEQKPAEEKPKGRHKFTREECQLGFERAIESIINRYPEAINSSGMHMACFFLKKKKAA